MENSRIPFGSASLYLFLKLRHDHGGAVHGVILHRKQRFIRLIKPKHCHLRLQADLRGQRQEVAGIGASHVGHAAQLALAP